MTVVAVLSMKGGVGKSTVALGLASAAWERGLRTLVRCVWSAAVPPELDG